MLGARPDGYEAEREVAQAVADYAEAAVLLFWEVRDTLPEGLEVGAADQLEAALRDNPEGCCMIIWMEDGND